MRLNRCQISFFLFWILLITSSAYAKSDVLPPTTTPIPMNDLKDYAGYSPTVKRLISIASSLSQQNLTLFIWII